MLMLMLLERIIYFVFVFRMLLPFHFIFHTVSWFTGLLRHKGLQGSTYRAIRVLSIGRKF